MSALDQEIQKYVSLGFMVVHQTETTAQLRKPKEFSVPLAIVLALISFGLLFILYAIVYAGKKDDLVYLTVDANGIVHATGTGVAAITQPRNSWESQTIGKSYEELVEELEQARRRKAAPEYIRFLEGKAAMHHSQKAQ